MEEYTLTGSRMDHILARRFQWQGGGEQEIRETGQPCDARADREGELASDPQPFARSLALRCAPHTCPLLLHHELVNAFHALSAANNQHSSGSNEHGK
jgi:hypothetical protein